MSAVDPRMSQWLEGLRTAFAWQGSPALNPEDRKILARLVASLRRVRTVERLRSHYDTGRAALIEAMLAVTVSPPTDDQKPAALVRAAYGLRYLEITKGRQASRPALRPGHLFDDDLRGALTEAKLLAEHMRHVHVTPYHLLRTLIKSRPVQDHAPSASLLAGPLDHYLGSLPSVRPSITAPPGQSTSEDLRSAWERASRLARRLALPYITSGIVLYVLTRDYRRELVSLGVPAPVLTRLRAESKRLFAD